MAGKSKAPKGIQWSAMAQEDWSRGYSHVAKLVGVNPWAARSAHRRLAEGRTMENRVRPLPTSLKPTDKPGEVARVFDVSIATATRWLEAAGRPVTKTGRRGRPRKNENQASV